MPGEGDTSIGNAARALPATVELGGEESASLATLMGVTEIPVAADLDGQLAAILAQYQGELDMPAAKVAEANLLESVDAGRQYNRESLAAQARIEQASAQTGQAVALLKPSVSVRANRGRELSEPSVLVDETTQELIPSSQHTRTDVSLTVVAPIFNLTNYFDCFRRRSKEKAVSESYRISDGDAYVATVEAYLKLVSSRLEADVAHDLENELAELLAYIEKRADAGAASVSDMARVRARSEGILSSRLELESTHRAAGSDFVRLTNLVPEKARLPVPNEVGVTALPATFEEAVAVAMVTNPEIAALEAELEAEKYDRYAAKSRFLPRFDAEYTDTYSDHAGGSRDTQRDRRLMMVLNWNLFSGQRDYYQIKERTARRKELEYLLADQQRRVVQALSANYSALFLTRERIASGYEELDSITTAAKAMSKRMLSGNQSLLDLLDVYNQRYQVRSRLINLHVQEMTTVTQLVRLTQGTPWTVEGE